MRLRAPSPLVALCLLAAAGAAAQPSTSPTAAGAAVVETEVRFANGGVPLAGVVLAPAEDAARPAPGVVIIHGSGPSDRTQAWASAFAHGLAARGIVVLLPDKRGSGQSGGDWREASFEELADDAIAAVGLLRGFRGVDRQRVGLLGLSQGGHVAPLAATRSANVAFVVDVSGSAVPITEQVIDEVEKLAQRQGFSAEQVERVDALHRLAIDYALTGEGWERYEESVELALAGDLAGHGVIEPFPRTRDHWVWAWARRVGAYDPLPHWRALEVPAVIAYGAQDTQIHVAESVALLLDLPQEPGAPRTVLVFGDSGHGLRDRSHQAIRADLLDFLARWVGLMAPSPGAGPAEGVAATAAAGTAVPAAAPHPCATPDHRRFDFWVGTWRVVNQAREEAPPGINRITLAQDGCALREEYTNGRFSGTSLSFWDRGAGLWRQTWIDNRGQPLRLAGAWRDGTLVMSGPPGEPLTDRITWTPHPDGTVRQRWEKSTDAGATWGVAFDGLYTRADGDPER